MVSLFLLQTELDNAKTGGGKCEHRVLLIADNTSFRRRDGNENEPKDDNGGVFDFGHEDHKTGCKVAFARSNSQFKNKLKQVKNVGQSVDAMAKIVFPSIFIIFNLK